MSLSNAAYVSDKRKKKQKSQILLQRKISKFKFK